MFLTSDPCALSGRGSAKHSPALGVDQLMRLLLPETHRKLFSLPKRILISSYKEILLVY
jgi:hypothetical protein